MARVFTKTNKRSEISCGKCKKKIESGEEYYTWKLRYGTKQIRCKSHPARPSEMTSGKLSGAYAAIEGAEEDCLAIRQGKLEITELPAALNGCADECESVKDEYQDSFDNIPQGLQEGDVAQGIQEKIDALDTFVDNLRSVASDIEGELEGYEEMPESSEEEGVDTKEDKREEWLENAEQAIGELEV